MIMWPLFLLSCVQASPAASSLVGYIGTPTECAKAHFVPGYNLGGEGFDVVTMERKGAFVIDTETWKTAANGSCRLYRNRYMNREVQKVPVSVVDWRILPSAKLGHSQNYRSMFNERHTEVTGGSIDGTDVLFEGQSNPSYDLHPLHMVLPAPHPAVKGLKAEVEQYIKNNAIATKCSERCQIGHRSNKRDPCACVCNSSSHIKSNCCPNGKGLATLKVFRLYAQNLYGDRWSQTDGSVEVTYGNVVKRTNIISNNDNPVWGETFEFGPITMSMANKLRFRVYDEDQYWNSDLLGECSFELHSGKQSNSCMLNHGTFFFSYTAECAPSLGGIGSCSPPNSSVHDGPWTLLAYRASQNSPMEKRQHQEQLVSSAAAKR
uniref:C2 domain-containing protein n=1 Tax=Takifugu rubripes TaxID=31033 RepID=A0A674NVI5_TAKRU